MAQKHKPPLAKPTSLNREEMLQLRLQEAEDTLQAIREGAVDALIVETGEGDQVFTLKSADYPYRLIIDKMVQGAVIFDDSRDYFLCEYHLCQNGQSSSPGTVRLFGRHLYF